MAFAAGGGLGYSCLPASAGVGGDADCWLRLKVQVRVPVVFQNLQVEAEGQIDGFGCRRRFGFQLSFRICRWRRQCRFLAEAAGGCLGYSCLPASAGVGGGADCWLRLKVEVRVVAVF